MHPSYIVSMKFTVSNAVNGHVEQKSNSSLRLLTATFLVVQMPVFSRSHSTRSICLIGCWHDTVVCLSVPLSGIQGRWRGWKLYRCVPGRQLPVYFFRHFFATGWSCSQNCCGMYRSASTQRKIEPPKCRRMGSVVMWPCIFQMRTFQRFDMQLYRKSDPVRSALLTTAAVVVWCPR